MGTRTWPLLNSNQVNLGSSLYRQRSYGMGIIMTSTVSCEVKCRDFRPPLFQTKLREPGRSIHQNTEQTTVTASFSQAIEC